MIAIMATNLPGIGQDLACCSAEIGVFSGKPVSARLTAAPLAVRRFPAGRLTVG
jgi:hypothetical protein